MATLWWKACPNECEAHLPYQRQCCGRCRLLRRNVGLLSRKMIALENSKIVILPTCKHDLIELSQINNKWYLLNLGPPGERPWMRFRIDYVLEEGSTIGNGNVSLECSRNIERPAVRGSNALSAQCPGMDKLDGVTVDASRIKSGSKRKRSKGPRQELTQHLVAKNLITPSAQKTARIEETSHLQRRRLDFDADENEEESFSSSPSIKIRKKNDGKQSPLRCRNDGSAGSTRNESPSASPTTSHSQSSIHSQKQDTQISQSKSDVPLSWLSLPLPNCESHSSEESPLLEETQLQYTHRDCASMTLSDWKEVEANSSGLKGAIAALILARNNKEESGATWLPSLLRKETDISMHS